MAAAVKPLVLADKADTDAAPQPVTLVAEDGTAIKQAENVSTEGAVADVVNALVAAGLMKAATE